MIDLTNTTFIIPIKIDSEDRNNNLFLNLNYLNFHFKTNIIIYELGDIIYNSKHQYINKFPNLNIKFLHNNNDINGPFHRTKYLNIMLDSVETPVVCNYDVDVIFNENIYKKCEQLIMNNELDMIYPYGKGYFQVEVMKNCNLETFIYQPYIFNILKDQINNPIQPPLILKYAEYGHAIFFNTSVYRKFGGENENFISWGPEDQERYYRFKKFNCKVSWLSNDIYHFDHERGSDSGYLNPYITANDNLFTSLKQMNINDYYEYYSKQEYYKNYQKINCNNKK